MSDIILLDGDNIIYITGDKHANFREVFHFCYENDTSLDDILIVLGDSGINYYANEKDYMLKKAYYSIQ